MFTCHLLISLRLNMSKLFTILLFMLCYLCYVYYVYYLFSNHKDNSYLLPKVPKSQRLPIKEPPACLFFPPYMCPHVFNKNGIPTPSPVSIYI